MSKLFYVYEIIDPFTNLPFYVGKGTLNRCYDHLKNLDSKSHKNNKIRKILDSGNQVIIRKVFWTDNEQEAFTEEKRLILLYGRKNIKTGMLTNLTNGGEGVSGWIMSNKQRMKISKRVSGEGNPWFNSN